MKKLIFVIFVLLFANCGNKISSEVRKSSNPTSTGKVIGYLETREHKIIIWSSSSGPLYSVAKKSGEIILDKKSMEGIKAEHADIYSMLKEAVANQNSGLIDASNRGAEHDNKDVIEMIKFEKEFIDKPIKIKIENSKEE